MQSGKATLAAFCFSPLSIALASCLMLSTYLASSNSAPKAHNTLTLPRHLLNTSSEYFTSDTKSLLPRRAYLPNNAPFLGEQPWDDDYTFQPNLQRNYPIRPKCKLYSTPVDNPMIVDQSYWDKPVYGPPFRGNRTHFEIDLINSRCVKDNELKVLGLYGQGAYFSWLFAAAVTIFRHEHRITWRFGGPSGMKELEISQISSIDGELLALFTYGLVAAVDVLIRITQADYTAPLYVAVRVLATAQVISTIFLAFWLYGVIYVSNWPTQFRHGARFQLWAVFAVISSSILMLCEGVQSLQCAGSSRLSIIGYLFSPTLLSLFQLLFAFGLAAVSVTGSTFAGGVDDVLWYTGLVVLLPVHLVYRSLSVMDIEQWARTLECSQSWFARLLPTSTHPITEPRQFAILIGVVAMAFRGHLISTCKRNRGFLGAISAKKRTGTTVKVQHGQSYSSQGSASSAVQERRR